MVRDIIFGATTLPIPSIIIRSVLLYIAVIIATRLMGKRQVGIISGHNYLVAAGIVSLVAVRMVNPKTSLISGLVIVFAYALINRLWSFLDLKFPKLIDRKPVTLVDNGTVLLKNMSKVQLTIDDLLMKLRQKKIWNLSTVHQVFFEPTGEISVLKKDPYSSVTAKDMGITPIPINNPPQLLYFNNNKNEEKLTNKFNLKQKEEAPVDSLGFIINPDNSLTFIKKG